MVFNRLTYSCPIFPFYTYILKTYENLWISDIFRGYKQKTRDVNAQPNSYTNYTSSVLLLMLASFRTLPVSKGLTDVLDTLICLTDRFLKIIPPSGGNKIFSHKCYNHCYNYSYHCYALLNSLY